MSRDRATWTNKYSFDNPNRITSVLRSRPSATSPIPQHINHFIREQWDVKKQTNHVLTVGQRIRELYYSELDYDDSQFWDFKAIMGFGSFGIAALCEQKAVDQFGQPSVVDQVVVKAELHRDKFELTPYTPHISKEAWHMAQVNHIRNGDSVVGLRRFKQIIGDWSATPEGNLFTPPRGYQADGFPLLREWRSYLEYCRRGNLEALMFKYAAWGYQFPELFVWRCFIELARACLAFERGPFVREDPADIDRSWHGSFLLHNDMKPDNVFLGDLPRGETYPETKMADLGLSQIFGPNDDNNRCSEVFSGAMSVASPEKRTDDWKYWYYPFEDPQRPAPRDSVGTILDFTHHPITPASNIYGIGLLVHLMMTLQEQDTFSRQMDAFMSEFPDPNYSCIDFDDFPSVATLRGDDYSDDLKNLVIDCTVIRPAGRPSAQRVLERCLEGFNNEWARLSSEFSGDIPLINKKVAVYFDNETFNKCVKGPFINRTAPELIVTDVVPSNDFPTGLFMTFFWMDFWQYAATALPEEAPLCPPTVTDWYTGDFEPAVHRGRRKMPIRFRSAPFCYRRINSLSVAGRVRRARIAEQVSDETWHENTRPAFWQLQIDRWHKERRLASTR